MSISYQGVAPFSRDEAGHRREIARAINSLLIGKMNVNIRVTLSAGITTTLTDFRIASESAFHFMPETALAASLRPYVPSANRVNGVAVISHATVSTSSAVYLVSVLG